MVKERIDWSECSGSDACVCLASTRHRTCTAHALHTRCTRTAHALYIHCTCTAHTHCAHALHAQHLRARLILDEEGVEHAQRGRVGRGVGVAAGERGEELRAQRLRGHRHVGRGDAVVPRRRPAAVRRRPPLGGIDGTLARAWAEQRRAAHEDRRCLSKELGGVALHVDVGTGLGVRAGRHRRELEVAVRKRGDLAAAAAVAAAAAAATGRQRCRRRPHRCHVRAGVGGGLGGLRLVSPCAYTRAASASSPAKKSEVPSSYQRSPCAGACTAACKKASTAAASASNLSAYGTAAARPSRSLVTCEWSVCARMSVIAPVWWRSVAWEEATIGLWGETRSKAAMLCAAAASSPCR
eukprot:scaffold13663_cov71-Phaeocystis_antarctica.AAC.1